MASNIFGCRSGAVPLGTVIAQIVRLSVDGKRPTVLNLDLRALQHRSVAYREDSDIVPFASVAAARRSA
jgi:hypothetical protein